MRWSRQLVGWRHERRAVPLEAVHPMTLVHLDEVMAIEAAAYPFPWTRGNFIDSLASGYPARVLFDGDRRDHRVDSGPVR